MRTLFVAAAVVIVMVLLAALLGPQTPAPPLPASLVGDAGWLTQARTLSRIRLVLGCVELVATPLLLWVFIQRGWSALLRRRVTERGFRNAWLQVAAYGTLFYVASVLCSLPLAYVSYLLRQRYGLTSEAPLDWLVRQGLESAVFVVPFLIGIEGLYWLIRRWHSTWWLWASVAYALATIVLVYIQPLVITPIFFEQRPLDDAVMRERILRLANTIGITVSDVYVIDASSQGNEGNAYFTGVGGSTRIVLYDTLLADYTPAEIDTILAHEMGHWRAHHIWKGLALSFLLAPVGLLVVHILLRYLLPRYGIRGSVDVAGFPIILLVVTLATTATMPLQNWQSRRWEAEADRIALSATRDREAFAQTFVRLAQQNLSDPSPPQIVEALFATHPAPARRVDGALGSPLTPAVLP